MSTIFAQATAAGRAGVSVVRLSGPDALEVAGQLTGNLPLPRVAAVRTLTDGAGSRLDQAVVIAFPGPASFTGEDVVEFHLHGSIAIVTAVLKELGKHAGCRMAEPGEFTRRALENGRMNLTQVEGLADLIEAETEAQRKQALRVLSGDLGKMVDRWRVDLIRAAALLEATIDFADEDVPTDVTPEVNGLLGSVISDINREIAGVKMAERIRSGFEVAIVGAPNVGKSTLLNALAGREAAITSEVAGTTRDIIEVSMDLGGIPVTVLDTAGLRDSDDVVETIGISRALERAKNADVRVFLIEPGEVLPIEQMDGDIVLRPKADLGPSGSGGISGKTGQGISDLISRLEVTLADRTSNVGFATHERHRQAMSDAVLALVEAERWVSHGSAHYDIAAEEMRSALRSLEGLLGRIDVENLLDEIFSSFCLGK